MQKRPEDRPGDPTRRIRSRTGSIPPAKKNRLSLRGGSTEKDSISVAICQTAFLYLREIAEGKKRVRCHRQKTIPCARPRYTLWRSVFRQENRPISHRERTVRLICGLRRRFGRVPADADIPATVFAETNLHGMQPEPQGLIDAAKNTPARVYSRFPGKTTPYDLRRQAFCP